MIFLCFLRVQFDRGFRCRNGLAHEEQFDDTDVYYRIHKHCKNGRPLQGAACNVRNAENIEKRGEDVRDTIQQILPFRSEHYEGTLIQRYYGELTTTRLRCEDIFFLDRL